MVSYVLLSFHDSAGAMSQDPDPTELCGEARGTIPYSSVDGTAPWSAALHHGRSGAPHFSCGTSVTHNASREAAPRTAFFIHFHTNLKFESTGC